MSLMPLGYFFSQSWISFRRSGWISLAAVLVIGLSALAGGLFALLWQNTVAMIEDMENRVEIVAYFKPVAQLKEQEDTLRDIGQIPGARQSRLVSPAEAAEKIMADPALKEIMELLDENPLPASAHISLESRRPEFVAAFASRVKELEWINDVEWGQELSEKILKSARIVRWTLLGLGVLLALSALLIVSNAIRLTVYTRRDEIAIMRLVGASNFFIRAPFLMEGVIQGFIGGVLAIAFMAGTGYLIRRELIHELGVDLGLVFEYQLTPLIMLAMLLGAVILGLFGSLFAVSRHLKMDET
jgi:cell division transport system permease protein